MAGSFTLKSQTTYNGRYMYVTCTQEMDIASNVSSISWTLTVTGGESTYYTTGPTTLKINGEQVYYHKKVDWDEKTFPAAKGSVSGQLQVAHDTTGNATIEVWLETAIYNGVLQTRTGTWTLDNIPRGATMTSATDFTDAENPVIKYTNPLGAAVPSLQAGISLDGTRECAIPYRDVDKTAGTDTFVLTETDKERLYAATPAAGSTGNSRTVWIYLRTRIGEEYFYSPQSVKFEITDPKPVLNPTVYVDQDTYENLTGDRQTMVLGQSGIYVNFGATAQKGATIVSKKVTCGTYSFTSDCFIQNANSGVINFTVTDNRGNTVSKPVTLDVVNYFRPTIAFENTRPNAEGQFTVKITGKYFSGSFGVETNHLNAYFRYKKAGGSYGAYQSMTVTAPGDNYEATATVTLDKNTVYTFEAYVDDYYGATNTSTMSVKVEPVFDWSGSDFNFNVPVTMQGNFIRAKRCVVGQNSGANTNPWYKFASITAENLTEDMRISFKVTFSYGSNTRFAILNAYIRTANASGANATQRLEFESDTGLDISNFVLAYSGTGVGAVYELWVKLTAYRFCHFEILSESTRTEYTDRWVLYNQVSAGYAAEPTSGYTQVQATRPYLLNAYPVGSYYISHSDTSPASLFGGTWHRIESRFLWAASATSELGKTAGVMDVTLTVDQIPSHKHGFLDYWATASGTASRYAVALNGDGKGLSTLANDRSYTANTGGGASHTNMPPYVTVAIWRRTA